MSFARNVLLYVTMGLNDCKAVGKYVFSYTYLHCILQNIDATRHKFQTLVPEDLFYCIHPKMFLTFELRHEKTNVLVFDLV